MQARIAKRLVADLVRLEGRLGRVVEPFCGACNVTAELAKVVSLYVSASDASQALVSMWQAALAPPKDSADSADGRHMAHELPPTFPAIMLAAAALGLISAQQLPPAPSEASLRHLYAEIQSRALLAVNEHRLDLDQVIPLTNAIHAALSVALCA